MQNNDKEFLDWLINIPNKDKLNGYEVKFNDNNELLTVYAENYAIANVIAMAWWYHAHGAGYGVDWLRSLETGLKFPGWMILNDK